MKRILTTAAAAVFATGLMAAPAQASHCPKDVKKIDAALKMAKGDKMQMDKVKALRDKGDALHKAGKHGDAIKNLHEAMKILGIQH
ncbi:MAG: hypothetical protein ACE5GT_09810 [Rhodospirillales bacterium]